MGKASGALFAVSTRPGALPAATVRRVVSSVLAGERRSAALVSVSFVGPQVIRRLNRLHMGHDSPTDVLSFGWPAPGSSRAVVGDIYVCRAVAAREARTRRIPLRQELIRLVIHGMLHLLGHDHPDGRDRMRSPMWRRQERYVKEFA